MYVELAPKKSLKKFYNLGKLQVLLQKTHITNAAEHKVTKFSFYLLNWLQFKTKGVTIMINTRIHFNYDNDIVESDGGFIIINISI